MNVISLKQIVNNILLKRNYSVHWYIDFLVYAKDALRILTEDDLMIFNTKIIPLTPYNAIPIPNDYTDWVSVNAQVGQLVRPLVEDLNLNPLYNYDNNFQPQPYNTDTTSNSADGQVLVYSPFLFNNWLTIHWDDYGENIGRYFGGTSYDDTFRVIKQRNEIQINQNICLDSIILVYSSNGMNIDSATSIDGQAQECIEAYCQWQFKENNRTYGLGDAREAFNTYGNERRILRARISNMTIGKLKRISQRNTRASYKG